MSMPVTGPLVFAIFSCSISSFLFGYNIGVINAPQVVVSQWIRTVHCVRLDAATALTSPNIWCKSYKESTIHLLFEENRQLNILWSVVSSIFAAGALISAVTSSIFVNRFGPRGTLLINNTTAITGSICMFSSYFVGSYELLIIGRFIIGLNAGLNSGVPPMYLTEISPPELRGAAGVVHALMTAIGIFLSQILGLPQILGNTSGWPYLFGFSLIPSLLQVATFAFCPESPRHLFMNRCDLKGTKRALDFFQSDETYIESELEAMEKEYNITKDHPKVSVIELFRNKKLRGTIFICIMVMLSQQFSGINAVMFYSTSIFEAAGFRGIQAQYGTIANGCVFIVAAILSLAIIERAGRKPLLLIGLSGMMFTSVFLVVGMNLTKQGFWWAQYLSIASVFVYVFVYTLGPGPIPWFIASELFTQGPRAAAVSVVAGVNWICVLLVTFTFPLIAQELSEYTFLIFTGFLIGFVAYTFFIVPETKGKNVVVPESFECQEAQSNAAISFLKR